jgi:hypothetical protein
MRQASLAALTAAALLLPSAAVAGKATTTRIETRPFYGATVTLEEGVRVFRPLPYHDRVIINPGARASVSLGFEENRTFNFNTPVVGGGGNGADDDRGHHKGIPIGGLNNVPDVPTEAKRNLPIGRARRAAEPVHKPPSPPKH